MDRPSPQPSLRRQNAVLPERGSAAMRSAWLSLPTGAKGPLAQLMSPPVEQALPEGSRGPLAALMHHDARSESIQAAQRLSPRDTDDQALAIAEAPLGPGANSDGWDTVQADSTSEIVPAEDGPPPTTGPAVSVQTAQGVVPAAHPERGATDGLPSLDALAQAPEPSRRSKNRIEKKIDLVRQPDAHVSGLPAAQISALAQALGLRTAPADALSDAQATASAAQAVAHRLQRLRLGEVFTQYDGAQEARRIKDSALVKGASSEKRQLLQQLAMKTHLWLRERETVDPVTQRQKVEVGIYFDGIPDRAGNQVKRVIQGGIGDVYRKACEAGQLVANILQERAESASAPDVEIVQVCGLSIGGGSAQMFTKALQGHIALDAPPSLILLDPALLSQAQVRHAAKGTVLPPQKRPVEGLIITLDYEKKPRKNLVDNLRYLGYQPKGLVRLALGLKNDDGVDSQPPKPSEAKVFGKFLGYHSNRHHYEKALLRFAGAAPPPEGATASSSRPA
ncbi:hypothetical protein M5C96_16405 [Acidovorax sp. GBBC 1281]|uniref:hypothetical protein n=1 Tax=Acidovorax sp. GBBC 1281 TaxID=2940492 RepID=UPI00234A1838|nr:hypothetical protein [Acidovorax sp. GBBC 1281]WCM96033.1 hypothetical protein M5C96_16405 [Acidovorax sp. GBBC 1281]